MWRRPKRWRSAAAVWLHTPHTSHICVALCSLGLSVSLMTVMSMSNQLQETHYLRSLEQWSCSLQIVAPRCAITTKTKSHAIRMSSFCFSFIAHVGTANFFSRIPLTFRKKYTTNAVGTHSQMQTQREPTIPLLGLRPLEMNILVTKFTAHGTNVCVSFCCYRFSRFVSNLYGECAFLYAI